MSQLPYWKEYVQALGPTVVAIVVGFIAALIAYRQWKTAHYQLCLDMFEKRFAVYTAIKNLIDIHSGRPTREELNVFYKDIRGAEFFFDGETRHVVMDMADLAWRAANLAQEMDPDHPQAAKLDKILEEVSKMTDRTLEAKFRRYLDLSKVGLT